MALYEVAQAGEELMPDALSAAKVRQNIAFVHEQFVRSLEVCDLELLPVPQGRFNALEQKAVSTVPVPAELDGTIQNVLRLGWTLRGHVFRPAEVVVGKAEVRV